MKRFISLTLAAVMVLAFGTGLLAQQYVRDEPVGQYSGELRIALLGDPKTFNRYLAKETSSTDVLDIYLFEGLTGRNGVTTEIEPQLAKSWEFSDDGLVWTFYLREGVYWHDGVEFTADDVIFSFDLVYDDNIPNNFRDGLTIAGKPIQYRKVDKYTVEFTVPEVFAPMLGQIGIPIVPKHILGKPWQEGRFNEMWGVDTPPWEIIGTGPFQMLEYRPNERVVFTRNPNYWQVDKDGNALPYLTRFVMRIAGDQDAMRLMFDNGETHVYAVRGTELDEFFDNEARGGYTVYEGGPRFSNLFVTFNQNELTTDPVKARWFQNRTFRQAVAHAIDKQSITDIVFGGRAVDQWSPVYTPNRAFYNDNVRTYEYDLDKAAQLLAEAGFVKGADGRLRDWDGNVVEFDLTTNEGNFERETLGTLLTEDLTELGMTVRFNPIDFNVLVDQLNTGQEWEAMIMGLSGAGVEPHGGQNVWKHNGGLHMWNVGRDEPQTEWEARINELFDLGATTLDQDERYDIYAEWQEIAAEELPLIFTVTQLSYSAVHNNFKNVQYTAFGGTLHNIASLWFDGN